MKGVIITAKYMLFLELYLLLCHVRCLYSDGYTRIGFRQNAGINTDFKFSVPARTKECFYTPMERGGRFEISYLVFQHKEIDFYILGENNQVLAQDSKSNRGAYTVREADGGTYAVCYHNYYSAFSSVLVYMQMVTYESVEFNTTLEELSEMGEAVHNLTETINRIRVLTWDMKSAQRQFRVKMIRDTSHLEANEDYVFKWSLTQCVITVMAALIQVYSIRWLFIPAKTKFGQGRLRA